MALTNKSETFSKNCPICNIRLVYSSKAILNGSIRDNCKCGSCARSGKNNPQYGKVGTNTGKKFSEEHKRKISQSISGEKHWFYGKHLSDVHRKKQSESLKKMYASRPSLKKRHKDLMISRYLDENEREKTSLAVKKAMAKRDIRERHLLALAKTRWLGGSVDVGQIDLLNKWNGLGFHFQPNYQVKTDVDLFYLDGYDPIHNVVIEYDSKYHNKPYQQEKDFIRQNKIIDTLKPKKFWRYDAVNKKFRNVLERSS